MDPLNELTLLAQRCEGEISVRANELDDDVARWLGQHRYTWWRGRPGPCSGFTRSRDAAASLMPPGWKVHGISLWGNGKWNVALVPEGEYAMESVYANGWTEAGARTAAALRAHREIMTKEARG